MSFRNRRSPYSNSHNRNRTRMDMRDQTDPATIAGVRNTHRDGAGNIIGGQDRYGRNFGTKANQGSGIMQGGKRTPFYRQPVQAPTSAVTTPSASPVPAKRPPTTLPVEPASMRRPAPQGNAPATTAATAKPALPESKLTPQIATSTPGIAPAGTKGQPRINRLTGKPFGYRPGETPAAPAPAPSGIAAKPAPAKPLMTQPATGKVPSWKQATAPMTPISGTAAAPPRKGGLESTIADIAKSQASTRAMIAKPAPGAPTTSFAVKPTPNPQAIGATPASTLPAPASQFAQLTAPKSPAAPAQSPAPTSSFRRPVTPPAAQSGPSMIGPEGMRARNDANLAARKTAMQATKDAAYNRQPDLPVVAPDSLANKAYKGLRARWTTP